MSGRGRCKDVRIGHAVEFLLRCQGAKVLEAMCAAKFTLEESMEYPTRSGPRWWATTVDDCTPESSRGRGRPRVIYRSTDSGNLLLRRLLATIIAIRWRTMMHDDDTNKQWWWRYGNDEDDDMTTKIWQRWYDDDDTTIDTTMMIQWWYNKNLQQSTRATTTWHKHTMMMTIWRRWWWWHEDDDMMTMIRRRWYNDDDTTTMIQWRWYDDEKIKIQQSTRATTTWWQLTTNERTNEGRTSDERTKNEQRTNIDDGVE
jgi:DNA-binding PadR family transcriptional regulator